MEPFGSTLAEANPLDNLDLYIFLVLLLFFATSSLAFALTPQLCKEERRPSYLSFCTAAWVLKKIPAEDRPAFSLHDLPWSRGTSKFGSERFVERFERCFWGRSSGISNFWSGTFLESWFELCPWTLGSSSEYASNGKATSEGQPSRSLAWTVVSLMTPAWLLVHLVRGPGLLLALLDGYIVSCLVAFVGAGDGGNSLAWKIGLLIMAKEIGRDLLMCMSWFVLNNVGVNRITVPLQVLVVRHLRNLSPEALGSVTGAEIQQLMQDVRRVDDLLWSSPVCTVLIDLARVTVALWQLSIHFGATVTTTGLFCGLIFFRAQSFCGKQVHAARDEERTASKRRLEVLKELTDNFEALKVYDWTYGYRPKLDEAADVMARCARKVAVWLSLSDLLGAITGDTFPLLAIILPLVSSVFGLSSGVLGGIGVREFLLGEIYVQILRESVKSIYESYSKTMEIWKATANLDAFLRLPQKPVRLPAALCDAGVGAAPHGGRKACNNGISSSKSKGHHSSANGHPAHDDDSKASAKSNGNAVVGHNGSTQGLSCSPQPQKDEPVIQMKGATFARSSLRAGINKSIPALFDIDFECKKGELILVSGAVGSGKSSFLLSLLGELDLVEGSAKLQDTPTAYQPQVPHLLNGTIQENVLFHSEENDEDNSSNNDSNSSSNSNDNNNNNNNNNHSDSNDRNQTESDANKQEVAAKNGVNEDILQVELVQSLLVQDLDDAASPLYEKREFTSVGHRGSEISGGQRARTAIARALYAVQARGLSLVLLDDPLASVDNEVVSGLWQSAILGGLASATRIVVVNSQLLPRLMGDADRVVLLEAQRLIFDGPPIQLSKFSPKFGYTPPPPPPPPTDSLPTQPPKGSSKLQSAPADSSPAEPSTSSSEQLQPALPTNGPSSQHPNLSPKSSSPSSSNLSSKFSTKSGSMALRESPQNRPPELQRGTLQFFKQRSEEARLFAQRALHGRSQCPGTKPNAENSKNSSSNNNNNSKGSSNSNNNNNSSSSNSSKSISTSSSGSKTFGLHGLAVMWSFFSRMLVWTIGVMLATFAAEACGPLSVSLLDEWRRGVQGHNDLFTALFLTALIAGRSLCGALAMLLRQYGLGLTSRGLRRQMDSTLLSLGFPYFWQGGSATQLRTAVTTNLEDFEPLSSLPVGLAQNLFGLLAVVASVPQALPLVVLGAVIWRRLAFPKTWVFTQIIPMFSTQIYQNPTARATEEFDNLVAIRAMRVEDQFDDRMQKTAMHVVYGRALLWGGLLLKDVLSLPIKALFVFCAVACVVHVKSAGGDVAQALVLYNIAWGFVQKINDLNWKLDKAIERLAQYRVVEEFLETIHVEDSSLPLGNDEKIESSGLSVEFDNVSFRYAPNKPWALKSLSLYVPAGEYLGVVGPTGSGKSTFLRLLLRLGSISEGSVKIGDSDLSSMSVRTLRKMVGVVPQEASIFRTTLRANLFGTDEVCSKGSDAEALSVCSLCGLNELFPTAASLDEALPGLSIGQRQLLAAARVILRRPPILVLDEATAALSAGAATQLLDAISRSCGSSTVFSVAHRLKAVMEYCHRLLVLAPGGRLDAVVTRAELLQERGGGDGGHVSSEYLARQIRDEHLSC